MQSPLFALYSASSAKRVSHGTTAPGAAAGASEASAGGKAGSAGGASGASGASSVFGRTEAEGIACSPRCVRFSLSACSAVIPLLPAATALRRLPCHLYDSYLLRWRRSRAFPGAFWIRRGFAVRRIRAISTRLVVPFLTFSLLLLYTPINRDRPPNPQPPTPSPRFKRVTNVRKLGNWLQKETGERPDFWKTH